MRDLELGRYGVVPADAIEWRFLPSGGPGGQHANRSNTRAEARLDLTTIPLSDQARSRLIDRLGDEIRVVVDDERSQARNRALACSRLEERLLDALKPPPKARRPSRPSKAAVERRLEQKRRTSERKRDRRSLD